MPIVIVLYITIIPSSEISSTSVFGRTRHEEIATLSGCYVNAMPMPCSTLRNNGVGMPSCSVHTKTEIEWISKILRFLYTQIKTMGKVPKHVPNARQETSNLVNTLLVFNHVCWNKFYFLSGALPFSYSVSLFLLLSEFHSSAVWFK
jgi:hypothetical protein